MKQTYMRRQLAINLRYCYSARKISTIEYEQMKVSCTTTSSIPVGK